MEKALADILGKPSDFKVCKNCNRVNWYENEECIECGKNVFDDSKEEVIKNIESEIKFYIETEGYTEGEAEDVITDI